jgi:hypothetical protein
MAELPARRRGPGCDSAEGDAGVLLTVALMPPMLVDSTGVVVATSSLQDLAGVAGGPSEFWHPTHCGKCRRGACRNRTSGFPRCRCRRQCYCPRVPGSRGRRLTSFPCGYGRSISYLVSTGCSWSWRMALSSPGLVVLAAGGRGTSCGRVDVAATVCA